MTSQGEREVSLLRFYSSAPRPLVWRPRSVMLTTTARLEPVQSYMAPVMQWANVAQWRQGGAHRGKKVRLVSAARLRRLEDEAEDYLLDAFGELRGDTEERERAEKAIRAASSSKRKGKMAMATRKKRKKAIGRGGSRGKSLFDDGDDAIGAMSDEDEALVGAASLRKLKAGKVIRKRKKTLRKSTKKKAPKAATAAATAMSSGLAAKMKLSVAVPNKSTRTPRPLASRENEHSDDFRTPNMEKENEGVNVINTAPPAPRKKMPRRAAIRKRKSPGQEDPYDLSSDSDEDDNDNFIDELSPTAGLAARQKDTSKGRRAIQL